MELFRYFFQLLHDFGVVTAGAQGARPPEIEADFGHIGPKRFGNRNGFLKRVVQAGIEFLVQ